jgi:hypothetical protein
LAATWVPHAVRDQVMDFVRRWSEKTEIGVRRFIHWLESPRVSFMTGGSATDE